MDTFSEDLVMKFTYVPLELGVSDIIERNKTMKNLLALSQPIGINQVIWTPAKYGTCHGNNDPVPLDVGVIERKE